jgi:chromosome segregation ATPase
MTAPRLFDSENSRWTSRVERLQTRIEQLERKLDEAKGDAYRVSSELRTLKDNLFLLAFAIVNAVVIVLAFLGRR